MIPLVLYNSVTKRLVVSETTSPTGIGSQDHIFRTHCQRIAIRDGFTHWAQPAHRRVECGTVWQIFRVTTLSRELIAEVPSQGAAEMWLVHRG